MIFRSTPLCSDCGTRRLASTCGNALLNTTPSSGAVVVMIIMMMTVMTMVMMMKVETTVTMNMPVKKLLLRGGVIISKLNTVGIAV